MQQKYIDFQLDTDDMRLFAQFTKYMRTVLWRARRDYLEREIRYKQTFLLDEIPLEEKYDVEDTAATEEIERLLNWEMLKSHLKVLTLREAEVITDVFINKLSHEECARRLGTSRPNVTMLYRKALKKLRKSMEEDAHGSF